MGFRKTEVASLSARKPIYNLLKLGLTPRHLDGFSLKSMAQLTILGRDLRRLSRHHVCSGSVKFVVTSGNWSQPFFQFVLAIVESRSDVLYCD